jgi:c(7)-type cytochrome triheme protein
MSEGGAIRGRVKDVTDANAHAVQAARAGPSKRKRSLTLVAVPLLILLCLLAMILIGRRAFAVTGGAKPVLAEAGVPAQDYSRFSHSSPKEHADLMGRANCVSCHRRGDASPEPRLPAHKDCMGCHLTQFTAVNISSSENPICTICHTKEGLNSPNAPLKKFPGLRSFNAQFDHAQHLLGNESARPREGCAACHTPARRGVAQSIPARLNAHQTCYQCHSPGRQSSNLSSCGYCHKLGPYSPTSTTARAYRVSFSHADHGPRQRLSCQSCHNVMGQGLPQGRQVSSILPAQHFSNSRAQSCITCHNGQRAFGDTDFNDCRRCHKAAGFRMGE